ncbi:MAG: nuclease [Castellaniella sp.]|uniref:thermonuclease family protein n=1 Tax=Castellaniella sp. TaxID=1955812 RepID=UPI00120865D2|nr:thermonuclease family protein [Castellaniella sp.]TAN30604.1 MAG: nuclease [Castellaniella sp.]
MQNFGATKAGLRVAGRLCGALLVGLLAVCAAQASATYALTGRVVHVADGDTLTLLVSGREHRIRLASIDAPEVGHGRKQPGQPYGQASRRALSELVAGKSVVLRCYEQDRYGRDVCDVPLGDGRTANRVQVATGMAWANQQGGGKYLRDDGMRALETKARDQRLGVWRDRAPVPPWDWRWKCWKALESGDSTPIC